MYTLEELKSIVEKYVRDILQQHDLSVARNSTNKKMVQRRIPLWEN